VIARAENFNTCVRAINLLKPHRLAAAHQPPKLFRADKLADNFFWVLILIASS
jgi:hypothetical protein